MVYRFIVKNDMDQTVIEVIVKGDSSDEKHQRQLKQSIVDYLFDSGYVSFNYEEKDVF